MERELTRTPHMIPRTRLLSAALTLLWVAPTPALGQAVGDLGVTPTRIILEGRTRTARLSLINRGAQRATYRIKVVDMRMTESGKFEKVETPRPDEKTAAPLIRFAPRQVILAPGGSQTVRILLRKPRNLAQGEYRSHIHFNAVPKADTGRDIEASRETREGIRVRLIVVPGVAIPVIVRHGKLTATANLSELRYLRAQGAKRKRPQVSIRLNRQGNRSIYGDVTVTYRSAAKGREYVLARVNGLAVYTPNAFRLLTLPLQLPKGLRRIQGQLHVAFSERPKQSGKVQAQSSLSVR